jgi:hypothetical protein
MGLNAENGWSHRGRTFETAQITFGGRYPRCAGASVHFSGRCRAVPAVCRTSHIPRVWPSMRTVCVSGVTVVSTSVVLPAASSGGVLTNLYVPAALSLAVPIGLFGS